MVMPAAVKEAGEAADQAIAELDRQRQDNLASAGSLDNVVVEKPVDQTAEVVEPEHEPVEETPKGISDSAYEQKYKTLMGKYNAEVPRLQHQIAELSSRMGQFMAQPAGFGQAASKEDEAPKGPAHSRYLKPEEVEDYGTDVLELQARMAKGVAEDLIVSRVEPLVNRIAYLESKLESSQSTSFWDRVEQEVPGAAQINDQDPLWHDFLSEIEPHSGLPYREIGERAFASGDASRLSKLLKLYLGNGDVSSQDAGAKVTPAPKKAPPVKPGKSSGSAVPSEKAAPRFRQSEIKRFYDAIVSGKYKGREAERAAKEREIESAVQDGRIILG